MDIALGALSPPLSEQLKDTGIAADKLKLLDMDSDAINRLRIRGYLTDSATVSAQKKLIKEIQRQYTIANPAQPQPAQGV